MSELAKLHDEKYIQARLAGLPGWGGHSRIASLSKTIGERFLSFSGLPQSGKLLEIGCGAGNMSIELAKLGFQVEGIDFSHSAIEWARENALANSVEITFQIADVTNLSCYHDAIFDIVYDGNCIHCLVGNNRKNAFQEIRRVLKPGGIFFLSSLAVTNSGSKFPEKFDHQTHVLFESGLPYRYIPEPDLLELELLESGFEVLKKFVRSDSPFGHVNIHAQRFEQKL